MSNQSFRRKIINSDVNSLLKLKSEYDNAYHNLGNPLVTDEQYDFLVDMLRKKNPSYSMNVGAPIQNMLEKVKLPYNMGSMDKIKPENKKELDRWLVRNPGDAYIVEPKLDGISALLVATKTNISLYTRGDGKTGTDISSMIPHIKNIPNIKSEISVRGELIIKRKIFDSKYKSKFSNPRNFVSGVIMSKNATPEYLTDIIFLPYEVIEDAELQIEPLKQFKLLRKMNVDVNEYKLYKTINITTLTKVLHDFKESLEYDIDGLILHPNTKYKRNLNGNPSYSIAFKIQGAVYTTEVVDVIWQVSKWGKIIPRIRVKTVHIDGVNVNYTTGFNAKYVVDNNLGIGSLIEITRSGDVIPYIVNVIKGSKNMKMPAVGYKWSKNKVDFEIEDEDNDDQSIKKILAFFKGLGIKNINIQTVTKFYSDGYKDIFQILDASVGDIEKLSGFKNKMALKVYDSIHKKDDYKIWDVLGVAGVFGRGISSKKLNKLFCSIPNILECYDTISEEKLLQEILKVEGFSEKTANQVVKNLGSAVSFAHMIDKHYKILNKTTDASKSNDKKTSILMNQKIVFTGFRDKGLEKEVTIRGGSIVSNVSKNTFVVVKDKNQKSSSKLKKAQELGLLIVDRLEFNNTYL